jgi:hypothetical protein
MAQVIKQGLGERGQVLWSDATIGGYWVNPLLHRLLMLRPRAIIDGNAQIRESIRLGAILSLAGVRRRLGAYQVLSNIHVAKLQRLLSRHLSRETDTEVRLSLAPVTLWLLMLAAIEALVETQRSWFLEQAILLGRRMQLESWVDVRLILLDIFWIDAVHSPAGEALWTKV